MSFTLDQSIITGKDVTVWINPGTTTSGINSGLSPTLSITNGVPTWTIAGGTPRAFSTLGRIKFDNRAEHSPQMASNLAGGVARPPGTRFLKGYFWAYGDTPPLWPNDLFGCNFTLDGVTGHSVCNPCLRCTAIEVVVEPYSEENRNKCFYICHFAGAGFDFTAFTESGNDPQHDTTQPQEFPTKSLGLGIGGRGSISVAGGLTVMAGTNGQAGSGVVLPFVESMRLRIEALATQAWPSNVNGIAFTPRGTIDWTLKVVQCVNQWSLPSDPLIGDLDATQALLMATRLNNNLSFQAGWGLEYGDLTQKSGEYDHGTKILTTEYTFEKNILQTGGSTYLGSITDPVGVTHWGTIGS